MPTISDLHDEFAKLYDSAPQKFYQVKSALKNIEENLKILHMMGHFFDLVEVESPQGLEYPKMLYHDETGRQIVVHSKEAEDNLSEGWDVHSSLREGAQERRKAEAEERAKLDTPGDQGDMVNNPARNAPAPNVKLGIDPVTGRPAIVGVDEPQPIEAPERQDHVEEEG